MYLTVSSIRTRARRLKRKEGLDYFTKENIKNTLHKIFLKDSDSEPETVPRDETIEPNACVHSISEKDKYSIKK